MSVFKLMFHQIRPHPHPLTQYPLPQPTVHNATQEKHWCTETRRLKFVSRHIIPCNLHLLHSMNAIWRFTKLLAMLCVPFQEQSLVVSRIDFSTIHTWNMLAPSNSLLFRKMGVDVDELLAAYEQWLEYINIYPSFLYQWVRWRQFFMCQFEYQLTSLECRARPPCPACLGTRIGACGRRWRGRHRCCSKSTSWLCCPTRFSPE